MLAGKAAPLSKAPVPLAPDQGIPTEEMRKVSGPLIVSERGLVPATSGRSEPPGVLLEAGPSEGSLEVQGFRLTKHGEMPSPRAGMESHHGAMSRWMEEHYPDYSPDKAPAVLYAEGSPRRDERRL